MKIQFIILISFFILSGCNTIIYELNSNTATYIPYQKIPEGIDSISAGACGKCHEEIYQEWQKTMHSRAFTDPFFRAYWRKDNYNWSCLNCHTPLENQLENRIVEFKYGYNWPVFEKNSKFDPALQTEGVTCVVCHLKDGVIYGPYKKEELKAPHPVAYNEKFRTEKICLRCHQVKAKKISFLKSDICSSGNEWENGPYRKLGYICQTCHMAEVNRPLVKGMKSRQGRKHMWFGGHDPKQVKKAIEIKAYRQILKKDAFEMADFSEVIRVDVTNSGAGHFFPTGDPDRKVIITIRLIDSRGDLYKEEQFRFERKIIWQPIMIEMDDTRLPPKATKSIWVTIPKRKDMIKGFLHIKGIYQILTERQRKKLVSKYGLREFVPYQYKFKDRTIFYKDIEIIDPLNEDISKKENDG